MYKKWLTIGALCSLTSAFLLFWLYNFSVNNPIDQSDDKRYIFTISSGEKAGDIGERLEANSLIRSKLAFYLYVRLNKLDEQIKAGKFILYKNQTIPDIVNIITDKLQGEIPILIPEGYAIRDIDKLLSDEELIGKDELIKLNNNDEFLSTLKEKYFFLENVPSIEGFLFPDTYFINASGFNLKQFIERMLDNFKKKYEKEIKSDLIKTNRSFYEIIIMASIIEKEIKVEKDRRIAVGILWKRLDNDWFLGIDAAILYNKSNNVLTKDDLEKDSPYNTRLRKGLPPTPISNPGLDSIKSVLNPIETDYWYYLTPPNSNRVIYAKTNEEHNENKRKYLN